MEIHRLSFARRFVGRFKSRLAADPEWMFTYFDSARHLGVEFFDGRVAVTLRLIVHDQHRPQVLAVDARLHEEDDWQELDFVSKGNPHKEGTLTEIHLQTTMRARFVRLTLQDDMVHSCGLAVKIRKFDAKDLAGLENGLRWAAQGNLKQAIGEFESYVRAYSERNPYVHLHLAQWHQALGHAREARDCALRACAVGDLDVCRVAYEAADRLRTKQTIEHMRNLQSRAARWDIGAAPGAVMLDQRRELALEVVDGIHADCLYSLVEIRRTSAGRLFQRVGYGFDSAKEAILLSECRVIRSDDTVEEIPPDRVTVRDADDGESRITLEQKRVLAWILPELGPGDLVESRFHRLRRGIRHAHRSWPGGVHLLADEAMPTYSASLKISAPPDCDLKVMSLHSEGAVKPLSGIPGRSQWVLHQERIVPAKHTGHPFENVLLDPAVAIGPAKASWSDLARVSRTGLLGEHGDEPLPDRLSALIADYDDPSEALEHAFYFLRDDVKYASTRGGKMRVGVSGRADQILDSGVGDCADKSYLLHLICRELGLPNEFVLFDASSGRLCEEVPCDVFDHVLLRVEVDGEKLWLDASDRFGVYGSASTRLQGMRGLLLDDEGTVVRVPTDDPMRNLVAVRERFERFEQNMLAGAFIIEARGTSGRVLDEHLKSTSLGLGGQERGNAISLAHFLPEISLKRMEIESHATHSKICRVSGEHERGRIARLSGSGDDVARVEWRSPHLSFRDWPHFDRSRLVHLGLPIAMRVDLEFGREVAGVLVDRSVIENTENEVYSTTERVEERDGSLCISRQIVIRRTILEAPLTEFVPALTDAVARFGSIALRFNGRPEGARVAQRNNSSWASRSRDDA
jgi:hypothetical protein